MFSSGWKNGVDYVEFWLAFLQTSQLNWQAAENVYTGVVQELQQQKQLVSFK
jgi:hypothetical protein